jgi:acetyltransferase-like isoleucine patch superfamily enzyme/acyl carrier protein
MKWNEYFVIERQTFSRILRNFLINFLPDFWIINNALRPAIARLCGVQCGKKVFLEKGIFYGNPKNLKIGNKSGVCRRAFLDGYDKITLGDNVVIAFEVTFVTSNHEMGPPGRRTGRLFGGPIVVGDGVWIGARATIGPGVEIGAGSMVSTAAAVMKSVPPNSLVSGVPGTVIMEMAGRTAAPGQLPVSDAAPAAISGTEVASATQETSDTKIPSDGIMTKAEFFAELELLFKLEPGTIQGTESIRDDLGWDSMVALEFIAMADEKLHTVLDASALAECETVSDLVNLLPGRIT